MPEAQREPARNGDLVGRRIVGLPDLGADMRNRRDRRVAGSERARMQVDRDALGQRVAHPGTRDAQHRAPVALVDERGQARQRRQHRLHARGGSRLPCGRATDRDRTR